MELEIQVLGYRLRRGADHSPRAFDVNGMSDCGFAMDPEYLSKKTHISWARNVLDLQKAGIRRTDAVVIQEVSCLYLRYAKAHARMKLAKAPVVSGEEEA